MGKKGHAKATKKKLTKKEKKQQSHLRLVHSKKDQFDPTAESTDKKKAA